MSNPILRRGRREIRSFAYLCECFCVLCGLKDYFRGLRLAIAAAARSNLARRRRKLALLTESLWRTRATLYLVRAGARRQLGSNAVNQQPVAQFGFKPG